VSKEVHDRSRLFAQGLEAYRGGQHYEAHEHWEELWNQEQDEERSRFLQALIQIASAVHKAKNDVAPRGALRLVDRSVERLEGLEADFMGIDVAALRASLERFRAAVDRALAEGDGHCRLGDAEVPPIADAGDRATWLQTSPPPTVPAAARAAWFDRGLEAYARGEYFEAHELWEELWRDEADAGDKRYLQGLIQVAAAMHKIAVHRQPRPATRLLARALAKLRDAPPEHLGVDMARLLRDGDAALRALRDIAADGGDRLDPALVPRIERRTGAMPGSA
jgi:hypothetical protein